MCTSAQGHGCEIHPIVYCFVYFVMCCMLVLLHWRMLYFVICNDLNIINNVAVSIIFVHVFGNISASLKNVWIVE